jgi:hypothetical protein
MIRSLMELAVLIMLTIITWSTKVDIRFVLFIGVIYLAMVIRGKE